ncbi:MAG: amylosucrase [Oscillospiraceae bacterium]|jgi:amylosucrase|nr:amylosucrase [Oscillospiraceae bacterium]
MNELERRLAARQDELDWLYMELYGDRARLDELKVMMSQVWRARSQALRRLDKKREAQPDWFRAGKMLGVTMYPGLFAGDLKGVEERLGYLKEQGITYVHLMPLLKMPHPDNDGGYAVEDFDQVDPALGTNEDLSALAAAMRRRGMSLCLDFVINHTADTHEWAMRAKAGEREYIDRYICFDSPDIPREMEKTIPDVFPETAPGSFIYVEEMGKYVCSSFHPYQWDLNYRNPAVFNDMVGSMLRLTNLGVEVLRIDAVPYLWKELGTTCRNLPQVHTIMRMIRLITECVCPGVILKGEVVMAPRELAAYFGKWDKPECHLLYNASTMAAQWSALASADVRQLKRQLDDLHALPAHCCFVNYLRCHDDIGWGLNEEYGKTIGIDPLAHKKYLYEFFEGSLPGSFARGERYNYNPATQDARTCGTTASLCGIEKGLYEGDESQVALGVQRDLMMHAVIMCMGGFPMLSSGDEIGQLNGYAYHEDPDLREDSRNLHRTRFNWEKAALRTQAGTVQQRIWDGLRRLEQLRAAHPCFGPESSVTTWDAHSRRVLALVRRTGEAELVCLFNFAGIPKSYALDAMEGEFADLIDGEAASCSAGVLEPYQYRLCERVR